MLLRAEGLAVELGRGAQTARVLDGLDFSLEAGRTLGVVGESGCGKSMTALALMGLLPLGARTEGRLLLDGEDVLTLPEAARREIRGKRVAMVFQEPLTALNPVVPVGVQIAETLVVHEGMSASAAQARAVELLGHVGIAAAAERAQAYPHEMSGGMRQRVVIAMAVACRPELLIADEPTTALDVSVQAQILDLLMELQQEKGMAMLFISHNLGVVSGVADEIVVMYAGRIAERGPSHDVLTAPRHPYTQALIATVPDLGRRAELLPVIPGEVPNPKRRPPGCAYAPRCRLAIQECTAAVPALRRLAPGHDAACIRA